MKSIRTKFFISFLICIVIPWLLVTTAMAYSYAKSQNQRYINDTLLRIEGSLRDFCSSVDISEQFLYNSFISDTFNRYIVEYEPDEFSSSYRQNVINLDNYLLSSLGGNDFVDGVAIFKGDRVVSSVKLNYWSSTIQNSQFFKELNASSGTNVYCSSFPIVDSYLNEKDVFLIGKPIKKIDTSSGKYTVTSERIGSIVLMVDSKKILDLINNIYSKSNIDVCLGMEDGIICSNIDADTVKSIQANIESRNPSLQQDGLSGNFSQKIDGKKQTVFYAKSAKSNFYIYGVLKSGAVGSSFTQFQLNFLFAYIFCFFAFFIFTGLINRTINKPLQILRGGMKSVREGDLTVTVNPTTKDEIGAMCVSFNHMVNQLNKMFAQIHDDYKIKTSMEISMLQYQINPHFIYNVLSSIRFKALMNKDEDVAVMLQRVSRLLSRTIGKSGQNIAISSEIENVEDFIFIYCTIFSTPINVSITVDPRLNEMYVPNMLLQPIVENCFVHGTSHGTENFCIFIRAFLENEDIIFTISDDGVGMNEDTLKSILEGDEGDITSDRYNKIGINSVNKRLKLLFGAEYGISIDSKLNCFTKVTVKIPGNIMGGEDKKQ